MIAWVRVDSRLVHGQVVEAWLPTLHVARVAVVDDQAAASPLCCAAMPLALPPGVRCEVSPLEGADFARMEEDPAPTLVLVRDVAAAVRARERGLHFQVLNVGNAHFGPGRAEITPSVFLGPQDLAALRELSHQGVCVDVRSVPADRRLELADVEAKFHGAADLPRA